MSEQNFRALLDELIGASRALGGDPSIARIRTAIHQEMPEIRKKVYSEQKLGRIYRHFAERNFGIMSAFRGGKAEKENMDRQWSLAQDLRKEGFGYIPIVGKWTGIAERALFIPNISTDAMLKLGKKYEQDAVIWGSKGKANLIDPRKETTIMAFDKFNILDVDKEFDDYSALRFVKGKEDGKKVPVRPFRLTEEERAEFLVSEISSLQKGDVIYAEPSDSFSGPRSFIWNSTGLYRFLGEADGNLMIVPLLDEREGKPSVSEMIKSGEPPSRNYPIRWFGRIIRVANKSASIS